MNKKRIFTLITGVVLVISMLFMFSGCKFDMSFFPKNENSKIVGIWESKVDLSSIFDDILDSSYSQYSGYFDVDEFNIALELQFESDGTYEIEIDETEYELSLYKLKEDLTDGFYEFANDTIESYGLNMTADELFASQGMTIEGTIDSIMEGVAAENVFSSMENSGYYKYENGKLYTSETKDVFSEDDLMDCELVGDTLIYGKSEDSEFFPLYFTKK